MKAFQQGLTLLAIAAICHEANRMLCMTHGDTSHPSWDEAPEWQRDSALAGVRFQLENLHADQAGPEATHASWMRQKLDDGWTWGQEKNTVAKTHPCIVPYDELPAQQKAKDHLFRGICRGLLPFAELSRETPAEAPTSASAPAPDTQAQSEAPTEQLAKAQLPAEFAAIAAPTAAAPAPAPAPAPAKKATAKK